MVLCVVFQLIMFLQRVIFWYLVLYDVNFFLQRKAITGKATLWNLNTLLPLSLGKRTSWSFSLTGIGDVFPVTCVTMTLFMVPQIRLTGESRSETSEETFLVSVIIQSFQAHKVVFCFHSFIDSCHSNLGVMHSNMSCVSGSLHESNDRLVEWGSPKDFFFYPEDRLYAFRFEWPHNFKTISSNFSFRSC